MNHAIERRMVLIDFLLAYYGYVQRDALMNYSGISKPQASVDLAMYRELADGNMEYNASAKRWERSATFARLYE
jgi:hypothetical protein